MVRNSTADIANPPKIVQIYDNLPEGDPQNLPEENNSNSEEPIGIARTLCPSEINFFMASVS